MHWRQTKPTRLTKVNSGFYRMNNDDLEFVRLPSARGDDVLKTFAVFAVLIVGVIFGSVVYVMSLVVEPPSIAELIKDHKRVGR